jgi:hypothetical protein
VTPAPAQTAADIVLAALRIGKPYVLFDNPVDENLEASLALDVARSHVEATIRGREVLDANALVGYVFVLSYDGVDWSNTLFKEVAKGAARNVEGKLSYTTIGGTQVAIIKVTGGTIAMFSYRETIVMVLGATPALTQSLASSIIKAS